VAVAVAAVAGASAINFEVSFTRPGFLPGPSLSGQRPPSGRYLSLSLPDRKVEKER